MSDIARFRHPYCKENEVYVISTAVALHRDPTAVSTQVTRMRINSQEDEAVLVHMWQSIARTGLVLTGRFAGRLVSTDILNNPGRVKRALDSTGGNVNLERLRNSIAHVTFVAEQHAHILDLSREEQGYAQILAFLLDVAAIPFDSTSFSKNLRPSRGR